MSVKMLLATIIKCKSKNFENVDCKIKLEKDDRRNVVLSMVLITIKWINIDKGDYFVYIYIYWGPTDAGDRSLPSALPSPDILPGKYSSDVRCLTVMQ